MADFIDALEASGGVTLVVGTDTPVFMLDQEERFRLAADRLQWIVQRCKGVTRKGANEGIGVYRAHRFCTTRSALLRDLHELGIELTLEARARIEAFPETIREWVEVLGTGGMEVVRVANSDPGGEGGGARDRQTRAW